MPRPIALAFVAVLVVSSAGLAAADTVGEPVISVHLPDNDLDAGTTTSLDLFLLNGGQVHIGGTPHAEARVTTARQVVVSLRPGNAPLSIETGDRPVGNVPEGVVGPVTFTVSVNENAAPGTYVLPVRVSYVYTREIETGERTPAHEQRSRTLRTNVTVEIEGQAAFTLANASSTLAVGEEGTIRGTVTNTGHAPARDAVIVYTADNPNIAPVETEFAVGDLAAGESANFAFDAEVVDSADAGTRQLSFQVRYRDADEKLRRSDALDARFDVAPRRDVFSVEPVTRAVTAGETGVLELRVTNAGEAPVTDVSAKLFTDDPLSSDDDEAFVDRLEPGESATVRFALAAAPGALEKVYPVSLDFQYDDAEGDTQLSDTYDVPVEVTRADDGGGPSISELLDRPTAPVIGGAAVLAVGLLAIGFWVGRRR
ncbi:MAG: COG1361 S-layer family protein [Halobacteriales archaeon]